jgi:hypothetical protein
MELSRELTQSNSVLVDGKETTEVS